MTDPIHPDPTRKRGYRYQFAAKHHGGGTAKDARWALNVSRVEEFTVFDEADDHDIFDDDGRCYGVLRNADGNLRDLGTWQQQVAEFPRANDGVPWHGYPIWAVNGLAPANRSGERVRPAKNVFQKMEQAGLISRRQRKRLYKGDHT
ncbi:MAG: hypothetical protein K2R98_25485 [Gemmataceae bacterium]|nr:hypothetical protein [Gemmataceae bacterium]